jgi:hypothetical protein
MIYARGQGLLVDKLLDELATPFDGLLGIVMDAVVSWSVYCPKQF